MACHLAQRLETAFVQPQPVRRHVGRPKAVLGERLIDQAGGGTGQDHPHPTIPIGHLAQRLVEAAHCEERCASNSDEREKVVAQDRGALTVHVKPELVVEHVSNLPSE